MAKNYTYPRVAISSTAKLHSSVQPPVADTTVMFLPVSTEKGPAKEIVRIHSLPEFIGKFGNLSYERNGQQALNAYNWLRNGGTCYVYRLAGYDGQTKANISKDDKSAVWKTEPNVMSNVFVDFTDDEWKNTNTPGSYYFVKLSEGRIEYINNEDVNNDKHGDDIQKITFRKAPTKLNLDAVASSDYYFIANGKTVGGLVKPASSTDTIEFKNCLFVVKEGDIPNSEAEALYYTEKKSAQVPTEAPIVGSAKYFGEYYNNLSINIKILNYTKKPDSSEIDNITFNLTVYEKTAISATKTVINSVESFPRRNLKNYKTSLVSSDFIEVGFDIDNDLKAAVNATPMIEELNYYFGGANDGNYRNDIDYLDAFWGSNEPSTILGNPTDTPIDIMFDAGYPLDIKLAMMNFINNSSDTNPRTDIIGIFDTCELTKKDGKFGYLNNPYNNDWSEFDPIGVATNIALYDQYFLISDELMTGQNIYVTPTYFLSKLIAYNDMNYGIQFPTAGIRRGILDDAEAIFSNPTADEKENMFTSRINYAEKTPREYAFMNQRTHDNSSEESYTALSFLNNIRVLEKMKKELERIGRSYLFEFNDSITLAQLSSVLNKYVMNWIANRTLASGVVTVAKNPWSDEAVDVTLTVKFNGTIEVISVDITIE